MPPSHSFFRSLEAVRNLFKAVVSPEFLYSDFDASKDALIDLVALKIICSNFKLDPEPQQLNKTQQRTLVSEGTIRGFELFFLIIYLFVIRHLPLFLIRKRITIMRSKNILSPNSLMH